MWVAYRTNLPYCVLTHPIPHRLHAFLLCEYLPTTCIHHPGHVTSPIEHSSHALYTPHLVSTYWSHMSGTATHLGPSVNTASFMCLDVPHPIPKEDMKGAVACSMSPCSFQFELCKPTLPASRRLDPLRGALVTGVLATGTVHVAGSRGSCGGLERGLGSPPPYTTSLLPNRPTCQPGGLQGAGLRHTQPVGSRDRHQLLPPAAAPATCL